MNGRSPNFIEFSHLKEFCSGILVVLCITGFSGSKKLLNRIVIFICIISGILNVDGAFAQTNPTPQQIPYSQDFGNSWFKNSGIPAGFAVWRVAGSPSTSLLAASNSTPNNNESSFDSATVVKSNGTGYGYSGIGTGGVNVNNGQLYIQTSSNSSSGTDQLVLALKTTGYQNIRVSYEIEMINPQPKKTGIVFQYRVGNSGTFTVVDSSYNHNSSDRSQNQIDYFVSLPLNANADNQNTIQLRWAFSRDPNPVGSGSCGMAIDNIVVSADPITNPMYFRSVASGNWNATATWESSPDSITWNAATTIPSTGDKFIQIRAPHTVTTAGLPNLVVDELRIESGATLWNAWGTALAIDDGPNAVDLDVLGTLEDSSNISVVWVNTARWRLGNTATYIKTYNTNSTNWQLKYYNGISSIPSTSNWICRKAAGSAVEPSISTTNGGPPYPQVYYGNLWIENNAATWNSNNLCKFQGSNNYPVIKGNFYVGGNGSSALSFLNSNSHTSPVKVMGSIIIKSGCTLRNEGTGFEVQNNFQCDGMHTYGSSTSKLLFSGNVAQTISGSGTVQIWKLEINKSGAQVNVSKDVFVYGNINLLSGQFLTSASSLIEVEDNAGATGSSNLSFINGPMRKIGNDAFVFPVGKNNRYRSIAFNAGISASVSDSYTAEYFYTDPTLVYGSAIDPTLDHISHCEYWTLDKNSGSAQKIVTLSWDATSCGVTNLSDLRVARFNSSFWENEGNTATTGNTLSGTVSSFVTANYGPFTLASITSENPLPVELLSFEATAKGEAVQLHWVTATEINNDYFTIERSKDGIHFESVKNIDGAGNSTQTLEYDALDDEPFNGLSYYRIRQTDFDGHFSLSNIVSIRFRSTQFQIIHVFPDAANGHVQVQIRFPENGNANVILRDPLGRIVQNLPLITEARIMQCQFIFSTVAHGVYTIQVVFKDEELTEKFVY